jgi:hypothetical protein
VNNQKISCLLFILLFSFVLYNAGVAIVKTTQYQEAPVQVDSQTDVTYKKCTRGQIFNYLTNINYYTTKDISLPLPFDYALTVDFGFTGSGDVTIPLPCASVKLHKTKTSTTDTPTFSTTEFLTVLVKNQLSKRKLKPGFLKLIEKETLNPEIVFLFKCAILIAHIISNPLDRSTFFNEFFALLLRLSQIKDFTLLQNSEAYKETTELLSSFIPSEILILLSDIHNALTTDTRDYNPSAPVVAIEAFVFRESEESFAQKTHDKFLSTQVIDFTQEVFNFVKSNQYEIHPFEELLELEKTATSDAGIYLDRIVGNFSGVVSPFTSKTYIPETLLDEINRTEKFMKEGEIANYPAFVKLKDKNHWWVVKVSQDLSLFDSCRVSAGALIQAFKVYLHTRNTGLTSVVSQEYSIRTARLSNFILTPEGQASIQRLQGEFYNAQQALLETHRSKLVALKQQQEELTSQCLHIDSLLTKIDAKIKETQEELNTLLEQETLVLKIYTEPLEKRLKKLKEKHESLIQEKSSLANTRDILQKTYKQEEDVPSDNLLVQKEYLDIFAKSLANILKREANLIKTKDSVSQEQKNLYCQHLIICANALEDKESHQEANHILSSRTQQEFTTRLCVQTSLFDEFICDVRENNTIAKVIRPYLSVIAKQFKKTHFAQENSAVTDYLLEVGHSVLPEQLRELLKV